MPDQVLQNDECSSKGRKDGKEGETKSGGKEGGREAPRPNKIRT